jgi:Spy/CpxP family protein refolding chaperone
MIPKMVLAMATLGLAVMSAQPGGRGPRGDGSGTRPTPEQMVERRVDRLTTLLSLTASQVTTVRELFNAEQTAMATQRTALETAQDTLQTAVQNNAPDAQIDAAAAQVGTVQGQIAGIHAKTQAKLFAALTAEQRQKLQSLGEGRGFGGMMMGRPGPRGRAFPRY